MPADAAGNAAAKAAEVIAGSAAKDFERESAAARFIGAGTAGVSELLVFHPVRANRSLPYMISTNNYLGRHYC